MWGVRLESETVQGTAYDTDQQLPLLMAKPLTTWNQPQRSLQRSTDKGRPIPLKFGLQTLSDRPRCYQAPASVASAGLILLGGLERLGRRGRLCPAKAWLEPWCLSGQWAIHMECAPQASLGSWSQLLKTRSSGVMLLGSHIAHSDAIVLIWWSWQLAFWWCSPEKEHCPERNSTKEQALFNNTAPL